MNKIDCIKKDQSLIHATKLPRFWNRCFELCGSQPSGEDQEKIDIHSFLFCLLLVKLVILREGGRLPNKGRYGCVASAKSRPGTISPKT